MNDSGLGITKENLLRILPPALLHDPSIMALASSAAEALAARLTEIDQVRIIPNIDGLDEEVLDILARDFKVDWWDPEYSIDEKRRTLKGSWRVHKTLGTKAAVEMALRAIYPKAVVQEWFEYGGKPYGFRLNIDLTGEVSDAARPWRVIQRVDFYKSLRSHMDEIIFSFVLPPAVLRVGGTSGIHSAVSVPEKPNNPHFVGTLHAGGTTALHTVQTPAEDISKPPAFSILRTGGVCTILSNLSGG